MAHLFCSFRSLIVRFFARPGCAFGSTNDIGGEVRQPSAYADHDPSEAISDGEKGCFGSAYLPFLKASPTSPPISTNVMSYTGQWPHWCPPRPARRRALPPRTQSRRPLPLLVEQLQRRAVRTIEG